MNKTAIIIRGPAGVGKSTIGEILYKKLPRTAHVDIDLFKKMISDESSIERTNIAHDTATRLAEALEHHGFNIIVEELFRADHLVRRKELLRTLGYETHVFFFSAPLSDLIERDRVVARAAVERVARCAAEDAAEAVAR